MNEQGPFLSEPARDAAESNASHRMAARQPVVELFLMAMLFVLIASVVVAVAWKWHTIKEDDTGVAVAVPVPNAELVPTALPDFSLIDKDHQPVTLADLKGQVWIANFFFTSCPAQCGAMNLRMAQIQRSLPAGAAARLVSITVDPDKDSPEVLAEYAKTFHAKDDRWWFLTGDKDDIIRLAREGFKLPASENPNDHSLRLVLVDRGGRIRGYFNSTEEASIGELQEKINALLDEPPDADAAREP